jgi:phosphate transport system protein
MGSLLRAHFDHELAELREAVLVLGSRTRQAVAEGLQAFLDNDPDLVSEVIAGDEVINGLRYQIEQECYALLAREQPVAGDMRTIVTALTIVTELERIADHGKKIARICRRTAGEPRPVPLGAIAQLGGMALSMLDDALAALAARDPDAARAVSARDDEVDALYKQTFNVTLSYMLENARAISAGTHLIQVAHELERVADRATNVAERVIYAVCGELVDLNA